MSDTKLYIGNLSSRTESRDLKEAFSKYGRIVTVEMKRRYAFIDFMHRSDAESAINGMDGKEFDGSKLIVEWTRGQARSGRYSTSRGSYGRGPRRYPERSEFRIAVSNLPDRCHWSELKDHFRKAGEVVFGDVWGTKGVIEFKYKVDMEYALKELNGVKWKGYSLDLRKDTRRRSYSRSRSRSRRRSHRSRSRSRSPRSRSRSRTPRSRSRSRSRSPIRERSASRSRSPAHKRSRSQSRSRSPRSPSRESKNVKEDRNKNEDEKRSYEENEKNKEREEYEKEKEKDREDDRGRDREDDREKDREDDREREDRDREKDREREDRDRDRDRDEEKNDRVEKEEEEEDGSVRKKQRTD